MFLSNIHIENFKGNHNHTTVCFIHLPLLNRKKNATPLTAQSVNMPYQTAIGPIWNARTRKTQSATLRHHMVTVEVIMENRTSPAARIP